MPQLYPPSISNPQTGSNLAITDGTTSVDPVSSLTVSGMTLTDGGSESATLAVTSSGGTGVSLNDRELSLQFEANSYSDSSGGDSLTINGSVPLVAGKVGEAFSFSNNTNNRLSVPPTFSTEFGDKDWFVAVWVRPEGNTQRVIFTKDEYNATINRRVFGLLLLTNNKVALNFATDDGTQASQLVESTATLTNSQWSHVLVHYTAGGALEIYINGALDSSHTVTSHDDKNVIRAWVGVRGVNGVATFDAPFNGLIDQFIKGDFTPTAQEISALYNSGNGVPDAQSVFSGNSGTNSVALSKLLDVSFSQNTDFSQASSTLSPIIFDQENLDTGNIYDPTTGLITFPQTTTVLVSYNIRGSASSSGRFLTRFVDDGGAVGILETTNEISVTTSTFHTLSFFGEVTFQGGIGYALNSLKTFSQVYTALGNECYLRVYDYASSNSSSGGDTGSTAFNLTDTDAINYFTNHATLASTHEQISAQNLVTRLKDTGLWSKVEFLWVNLGDSVANVLVPLKGTAGTATRAITSADIEPTGGLKPSGSFVRLNFPALSSTSSYHLGWSKLPNADFTDGGVFSQVHYRDVSDELTGLKMESLDNQNAFWYAPGVVFAVAGSTVRSYEAGGFVGTTDGTVRLAAKSTSSTFSLANTPAAITTGQLTFTLPTASPFKQPAFCAGQHLSLLELTMLQILLEEYAEANVNDSSVVFAGQSNSQTASRELLTSNRTYYVRPDGDDSNDGLADSAAGAFLTIQKAVDVVAALDIGIHDVLIKISQAGTYNLGAGALTLKEPVGSGRVTIEGATTTLSDTVITNDGLSPSIRKDAGRGLYRLKDLQILVPGTQTLGHLEVDNAFLEIENFGVKRTTSAANSNAIVAQGGSTIQAISSYTIEGSFGWPLNIGLNSLFDAFGVNVVTVGNPTWGFAYVLGRMGGYVNYQNATFTGGASGPRVNLAQGAFVRHNTGVTLPGSTNGTVDGTSYFGVL